MRSVPVAQRQKIENMNRHRSRTVQGDRMLPAADTSARRVRDWGAEAQALTLFAMVALCMIMRREIGP